MCTVTFLPKENKSFILTHNRDEHFTRGVALLPQKRFTDQITFIAPIDSTANGTWIATSEQFTLCLLNGGFEKHIPQPPYKHSRGQVIIDFFKYNNIDKFHQTYEVDNLEPFTLIAIEHATRALHQFIFDGNKMHYAHLDDNNFHIWSSSTLYTSEDIQKRKNHFNSFLEQANYTQEAIIEFHTNKFNPLPSEGIQINRDNILKTVSLTSIHKQESISMTYIDFLKSQHEFIEL